jgi:hypothetical protein
MHHIFENGESNNREAAIFFLNSMIRSSCVFEIREAAITIVGIFFFHLLKQ